MYPRFGTDGVRGVANEEITVEVCVALARASAEVLGVGKFIIGKDTRVSCDMIEAALATGLDSVGATSSSLGIVPTPAVAWLSAQQQVSAFMISASHNPYQDNGIKVFSSGSKLSDEIEQEIEKKYSAYLEAANLPAESFVSVVQEPVDYGWEQSIIDAAGDIAGTSIVIDCANGAAFEAAPRVLRKLGAKLTVIGDTPDGTNINKGFGSTDTKALQKAVLEQKAELGLAFDGDADRLIAVDDKGNVVDGDRVMAILAKDFKSRGLLAKNTVVVTVMTNLGFHNAMNKEGITTEVTKVGDRYVLEALSSGGYSLGGEQSGHVICHDISSTGDGLLTGVQLVSAVKQADVVLSKVAENVMQTVPQILENVRLPSRDPKIMEPVQAGLTEKIREIETSFGDDGRVLVRPSGTEPLLRIMVEHIDSQIARKTCDELVAYAHSMI